MADPLAALRAGLLDWARAAARAGWLDADAPERLASAGVATPGALYDAAERPLVVGLFGGTGVGKSALLNRVAGREIARSSAERPTSAGVSAYVHASVGIDRLPPDFPMAQLHVALHHEARWADVLFVDMPDFDSVAAEHRELALDWLPYIDVVLYTVSPERYRDDPGWRLLLEHGREHAWLFVVNHWDRGDPRQLEDFRGILANAGFAEPELFRTVCRPGAPGAAHDDFGALAARLESLADAQLVRDLEARGVLERVRRLLRDAASLAAGAGNPEEVAALPAAWRARWAALAPGVAGAARARAATLARESAGEAGREAGRGTGSSAGAAGSPGERLIDEATRARVDDVVRRFVQEHEALPRAVAARHLEPVRAGLGERAAALVDASVGRAVAAPGTPLRRAAHRACRAAAFALPVAALGWAGWRAVAAFAAGGSDPAAYLGANFAINASLLVALAWGLPWLAARRLAPSVGQALELGLRRGADEALDEIGERVGAALEAVAAERAALAARHRAARSVVGDAAPVADGARALPDALRRLVADVPADAPANASAGAGREGGGAPTAPPGGAPYAPASDGVRATTHSSTDAAPVS